MNKENDTDSTPWLEELVCPDHGQVVMDVTGETHDCTDCGGFPKRPIPYDDYEPKYRCVNCGKPVRRPSNEKYPFCHPGYCHREFVDRRNAHGEPIFTEEDAKRGERSVDE